MFYQTKMSRALLLDFDGVIFRNKVGLQKVVQKSNEFTYKYVPTYDPLKDSYTKYGHTVHLINHKTTDRQVTFQEYNDYVFDNLTMEFVFDNMDIDDKKRADMWKFALEDREAHVFSNAPSVWVNGLLSELDMGHLFQTVITSDDMEYLKPMEESYEAAGVMLQNHGDIRDMVFMDDSNVNVQGARDFGIDSVHYTPAFDWYLMSSYGMSRSETSSSLT